MLMERPSGIGAFQFVILASLRAAQLMRGCLPRVDGGHKNTVTAQLEVSQGKVMQDYTSVRDVIGRGSAVAIATATPSVAVVDVG
jgi:hypothetical protein